MSFNNLRKALDELDAVATSDKQKAEIEKLQRQDAQKDQDNNSLRAEVLRLDDENSKLRAKANLKETEIQRRAQLLADDTVQRWHIEEKPWVVVAAVKEEIKNYPSNCTASTKDVLDARVEAVVQERLKEGWTPILFVVSNAIKGSTRPVAVARPVGKATLISVKKPDETKKTPSNIF